MKRFTGSVVYRGRSFNVRFCAKTIREAAGVLDTTEHDIRTYYHHIGTDEPFEGVLVTPFGSVCFDAIGHREMDYEEAKRIIDRFAEQAMKDMLK